jgi:transcriptional regulator with XRE-family HTH domain
MINKNEIARRLREERDRLSLSQHSLAVKAGVSRMSQVNYESGKRSPDAEYLKAVAIAGVDVGYVVTGSRSSAPDFYRMATELVLEHISVRTGFAEDVLSFVIQAVAEGAAFEWMDQEDERKSRPDTEWDMAGWIDDEYADGLLAALFENARLLRDVFSAINGAFSDGSDKTPLLDGHKRLVLVLMLYRAFSPTGEVDNAVVAESVKLIDPDFARKKEIEEVLNRRKQRACQKFCVKEVIR